MKSNQLHYRRPLGTSILIYFLALVMLFIILFPFYWIVCTSFKETLDIYVIPPEFIPRKIDLSNYMLAFNRYKVQNFFKNSMQVTVTTVVCTTLIGSLAAFSLTRLQFKGSKALKRLLGITQMFPVVVLLVPLFLLCTKMRMYNKLQSLVLPYIALQLPVSIILQSGYYKDVPQALEEAAKLDGCSTLQILYHIFFPIVTPGIVATGVYTFIQVWQEFLIASSLITKKVMFTLTVGLTTFKGDEMNDWGSLMATSVIIAIPALILFNLSQEFFINKVAGSVKE
ncbi:MAG: carbohydrate ABC transporter permease [Spirochaetales bacterium]|nr:carbohydrate ABC transporter permease [Spirochaetales bacterium]